MVQVKKDLPLKTIRGLAKIGCTQEEAAAVLDMSVSQFRRYLQTEIAVREAWDAGKAFGRMKIRALQWWHAEQKGPAGAQLTIHLSKHQLGETETAIVDHRHSGAIALVAGAQSSADAWFKGVDVSRFTDDEAIQFADLCDLIDKLNGAIALLPPDQFQLMTELVRKGQPAELVVEPEQLNEAIAALPAPNAGKEEVIIVDEGNSTNVIGDDEDEIFSIKDEDIASVIPPPPKTVKKK